MMLMNIYLQKELVGKLINATSKEDDQMLIDLIEISKDKIYEQVHGQYVIQPPHKCDDLLDTVKVIQQFNEAIQPYLT